MTWVRTEDSMPLHPKILRLSDGAFRLWENGLHFANRATTDGRIDKALVSTLNHHGRWTSRQVLGFVSELVPSLWTDCGDHYQIHDYEHHQYEATKARVESKRANWRGKKQRQRVESDEGRRNVPGGHIGGLPSGPDVSSTPPSRPVPSRSVLRTQGARAGDPDGLRAKLRSGYRDGYEAKLGRAPAHKAMSHPEWDAICAEVVSRLPDTTPTEAAAVVLGAFFACSKAERLGFPVGQIGTGIDAYCAGKPAETVARKPTQAIDPSRRIGVLD